MVDIVRISLTGSCVLAMAAWALSMFHGYTVSVHWRGITDCGPVIGSPGSSPNRNPNNFPSPGDESVPQAPLDQVMTEFRPPLGFIWVCTGLPALSSCKEELSFQDCPSDTFRKAK